MVVVERCTDMEEELVCRRDKLVVHIYEHQRLPSNKILETRGWLMFRIQRLHVRLPSSGHLC